MFFKRHPKPNKPVDFASVDETPADKTRAQLYHKYHVAKDHLVDCTLHAIVRRGVVDLYIGGVNRSRAVHDFEATQRSLECAIQTYDSVRDELTCFVDEHREDFVATADWDDLDRNSDGHRIVERVWMNFYRTKGSIL